MIKLNEKLDECKNVVDKINQKIINNIDLGELDKIDLLFLERDSYINDLIAFAEKEVHQQISVRDYLIDFQVINKAIIHRLTHETEIIRQSLLNIKQMEKYA